MPFDGNGNWTSNFSAVADRDAGIKILASRFDNIFIDDISQSFENCLTKDAQVKPTTSFDANNNRIIDVADPVADGDAVNLSTLNDRISKVEQDPILAFKWSDYEITDQSWLRADTFSWNDGTVYTNAYTHLYNDIQDITSSTETIGSYTITYYQAEDGHKIVLPDQEATIQNIYNESGIAWYYILDTTNQRFKLPRTKFGFTGYREAVGKYVAPGLPNITGELSYALFDTSSASGAFTVTGTENGDGGGYFLDKKKKNASFSASNSNVIYGNSTTVQEPATQMYLYFYVGQYTQSATEQTAGLNSSLFNGKVDLDLNNMNPSSTSKSTIVSWGVPDYTSGVSLSTNTEYTADKCYLITQVAINSVMSRITINGTVFDNNSNSSTTTVGWYVKTGDTYITGTSGSYVKYLLIGG